MAEQPAKKAPWVWDQQDSASYPTKWKSLAEWVQWLQEAYHPWVLLPPCWPAHEGLSTELRLFWYWHRWTMGGSASPVDAVRWHNDLRQSASAWRELAACTHEAPLPHRAAIERQRRDRTEAFVDQTHCGQSSAQASDIS
ncbi:hypothetical protein [Fodinicola acaciae]|uniref:hypothetical protein n=1 Tax=Fodinicola acaciae TaxID=2681555 RepID=UPI0016527C53|nr:hypothetical protein [Fodinicola acaciae]